MTVSLNKPNPGDRNWDVPVNQNWTTIENELNARADTDLSNLSQTGEAKLKSNIQLVSAAPASPVAGVLYCIPE